MSVLVIINLNEDGILAVIAEIPPTRDEEISWQLPYEQVVAKNGKKWRVFRQAQ